MTLMLTLFRRHNDGTVTDVYEDEATWVRDGDVASIRDLRDPDLIVDAPATFEGLRAYFAGQDDVDGVLFVHADGRQAQITRRDFGL